MKKRGSLYSSTKEWAQPVLTAKLYFFFLGPGKTDPSLMHVKLFKNPISISLSFGGGYVILYSVLPTFCAKEEKRKKDTRNKRKL